MIEILSATCLRALNLSHLSWRHQYLAHRAHFSTYSFLLCFVSFNNSTPVERNSFKRNLYAKRWHQVEIPISLRYSTPCFQSMYSSFLPTRKLQKHLAQKLSQIEALHFLLSIPILEHPSSTDCFKTIYCSCSALQNKGQ